MRFYYISPFSLILLGIIYLVGIGLIVWFGSWLQKRMQRAWMVMVPLFLLLLIGPISEELWIAWNFGKLCKKDAGIFVHKIVEVEGFYNATGATLDLVRPGGYRFIESYGAQGKGTIRLTYGDREFLRLAKERLKQGEGTRVGVGAYRVQMDPVTEALVYTGKGESWRITKLDRPTARYHYKERASHLPVSHKVKKFERVVIDEQTDDVLGRYLNYYRSAPWFFIGLDRPTIPCTETEDDTRKYGTISVYSLVLGHGAKGHPEETKK
jgi:hypothetical protein